MSGTFYICPECDEEGTRDHFTTWFCPCEPDQCCDGCEEDPDWLTCPNCGHKERDRGEPRDAWDEDYERQASRDRLDGFSRTNGRDWT